MDQGTISDKRTHKRFTVEGIHGNMLFASEVSIINISTGGAAVEADKRLNMGMEYTLKLHDHDQTFCVRGAVVWSNITHARHTVKGENVPIYHAGFQFTEMPDETKEKLITFIEEHRLAARIRLSGLRFIINREKAIVNYPFEYEVRKLSLGGMLIQCNQPFGTDQTFGMEIFLAHHIPVKFTGRVASCLEMHRGGRTFYNVGIEFKEMTDSGRINLEEYLKYIQESLV